MLKNWLTVKMFICEKDQQDAHNDWHNMNDHTYRVGDYTLPKMHGEIL